MANKFGLVWFSEGTQLKNVGFFQYGIPFGAAESILIAFPKINFVCSVTQFITIINTTKKVAH